MNPLDSLLTVDVLLAYLLLIAGGVTEPWLEYRLTRIKTGGVLLESGWQRIFGPLLRAALMAWFVLLAYPALFGVRVAPTLGTLLDEGVMRMSGMLNVLFMLSLILPALVPLLRRPGLMVPVQGLVATAIVFSWFTTWLGATSASWWPGSVAAAAIVLMVILAHRLAVESGEVLGRWIDHRFAVSGFVRIMPGVTELVFQTPAVLYYGLVIGRQLAV